MPSFANNEDEKNKGSRIHYWSNTCQCASVEHHGVQPTGCMDNEPEPSGGVRC